jgi:hypothetical protein
MPSGGSDSSNKSDQKSEPKSTHQQFFAAYNQNQPRDQQPFNVFKIFGQQVPS